MSDYRINVEIDPSRARVGRKVVSSELSAIERQADSLRGSLERAFAFAAVGGAIGTALNEAIQFGDKMAEVSTLVDTAVVSMEELQSIALEQAKTFGSMPTQQAAALYQIISAGAGTAARATEILTAANKLAVGGVTDVATAADGLTSVLNAYGSKVESAAAVSDAMFVAMRAGKTTIAELSAGLGAVAPLAAASGVSFDELVAATAALTKGGISTSESLTGLRAIMAAVSKPTSEAGKLAAQLGIDFNAAGLQAKGFGGFMEDLIQKTGGSSEKLAILFGGVEALVPAMALAGQAGVDFNNIMADMANKAGQTDAAFEKMSKSAGFQVQQLLATLTAYGIQLGTVLLQVLVPALTFVNENFSMLVDLISTALVMWAAYQGVMVTAAAAMFLWNSSAGITLRIIGMIAAADGVGAAAKALYASATAGATVATRAFTIALLANPLTAIAVLVAALAGGIYYLASAEDAATAATNANTEAQAQAAALQAQRAQIIMQLSQATANARAETIAYMEATYKAAKADLAAAEAAMVLARARRADLASRVELEAAEADSYEPTSTGAGLGYAPSVGGSYRPLQSRLYQVDADIAAADKAVADATQVVGNLGGLIQEAKAIKPAYTTLPSAPSVASGANTPKPNTPKPEGRQGTTFDDIQKNLEKEVELSKLAGVEREVRMQQLQAEEQLERKLTYQENFKVRQLVTERAALEAQAAYKEQILDNLDREYDVMQKTGAARAVYLEQLRAEDILGRKLTTEEANTVSMKVQQNEAMADQMGILEEIRGPMEDYRRDIAALNALLERGAITQREFNLAVSDLKPNAELRDLEKSLGGDIGRNAEIEQVRLDAEEKRRVVEEAEQLGLRNAQQAADLRVEIARDEAQRIKAIQDEQKTTAVTAAQSTFESLSSIAKDFAGEQSAVYKAMFVASKAFAIADSIIKIQQAMANALSLPFPANLPAISAVAAQAASIVSNIQSISLNLADGGMVRGPGSSRSDSIPANLSNGEYVVNARGTAKYKGLLDAINSGRDPVMAAANNNSPSRGRVTVQQHPGVDLEVREDLTTGDIEIIARRVAKQEARSEGPKAAAAALRDPNSQLSKAVTTSTTARRRTK